MADHKTENVTARSIPIAKWANVEAVCPHYPAEPNQEPVPDKPELDIRK
jgi:hypothetical protein